MWSDRTAIRASTKSSKQSPPFGWAVKLSALFIAVLATFAVAELLLALMARFDEPELTVTERLAASGRYSREELRTDLPHFTERQGANCITIQSGLHWDPRFGFVSKILNKDCARTLFAAHAKSVVLMGGSAMENSQAPNYLTTLDSYAFGDDTSYASINMAESGARHSNMLARFLYEIVELRPTHVVFLDGFNEFASIRYGGKPEDDFYWTAGVNDRIHRPFLFLRDKLVDSSRLLTLLGCSIQIHQFSADRPYYSGCSLGRTGCELLSENPSLYRGDLPGVWHCLHFHPAAYILSRETRFQNDRIHYSVGPEAFSVRSRTLHGGLQPYLERDRRQDT